MGGIWLDKERRISRNVLMELDGWLVRWFFFSVIRALSKCHGYTAALRHIVRPYPPLFLDVPTSAARCLHARNDARDPSSERWNCVGENYPVILPKWRLPRKFRDLLHAANLRHGTDGLTFPSEGRRAEDFFALKNPDGFGRIWTRELGYLKAARYPWTTEAALVW
jgi:hypothetical protein